MSSAHPSVSTSCQTRNATLKGNKLSCYGSQGQLRFLQTKLTQYRCGESTHVSLHAALHATPSRFGRPAPHESLFHITWQHTRVTPVTDSMDLSGRLNSPRRQDVPLLCPCQLPSPLLHQLPCPCPFQPSCASLSRTKTA